MMDDANKDSKVPSFQLHSRSSDFNKKFNDIFGGLQALEDKHLEHDKQQAGDRENLLKKEPSLEETETIVSGFKKPSFPSDRKDQSYATTERSHDSTRSHIEGSRSDKYDNRNRPYSRPREFRGRGSYGRGRSHKTPDYKIHPEKWTEYSLEDVGADDMSGAAMKQAAFEFLEQRRAERDAKNKEEQVNLDESACSKGLLTFKRPSKTKGQGQFDDVSSTSKEKDIKSLELMGDIDEIDSKNEVPSNHGDMKDMDRSQDGGVASDKNNQNKPAEKVVFQSRKAKKRNIRVKDSNDSD